MRNFRISYPSLNDPNDQVALDFRKTVPPAAIPSTLVIARSGRIAARVIGGVIQRAQGPHHAGLRGARMIMTAAPDLGGDQVTGLRNAPRAARAGPRRAGGRPEGAPTPSAGGPGASPFGPGRLAALGLAAADLDAHRADPAVPARGGQRARVAAAAAGHRPGGSLSTTTPRIRRWALCWPSCRCSTCSQRPGSPRSTCCCSLSLVGCVLPRTVRLARSARASPRPRAAQRGPAPVRPAQPHHGPAAALEAAARMLAGKFRLRTGPGWVAAEKGYLRDPGNLLFHIALLGVLVLDRPRRPVRVQGQPAAGRGQLVLQHGDGARRISSRPPGVPERPAAVLADAGPVPRVLRHVRHLTGQPAAFDAAIRAAGHARTATATCASITRCRWTACGCS